MAPIPAQCTGDNRQSTAQPLSPLNALGRQAQHFRCQLASGLQQRVDGAVDAVRSVMPQNRYDVVQHVAYGPAGIVPVKADHTLIPAMTAALQAKGASSYEDTANAPLAESCCLADVLRLSSLVLLSPARS